MKYGIFYLLWFVLGFLGLAIIGHFLPSLIYTPTMFTGVVFVSWLVVALVIVGFLRAKYKSLSKEFAQEEEENRWETHDYRQRL